MRSLTAKKNKDKLTRFQKTEIITKLNDIVDHKLPNPEKITHDGYKITTMAEVFKLGNHKPEEWNTLINSAKKLANIADRSLVLSILCDCLPSRFIDKKSELITETLECTEKIFFEYDKASRYHSLASQNLKHSTRSSKDYLKCAMKSLIDQDSSCDFMKDQIIDTAYKLDPDFAAELASFANDDPAIKVNTRLNKKISVLNLKKQIADHNIEPIENLDKILPQAAWALLGSLNSGRTANHIDDTMKVLKLSSGLPLRDAYPILSWAIQNNINMYENTDQASSFLKPIFEATLLGVELVKKISFHSSRTEQFLKRNPISSPYSESRTIKEGEREEAFCYIRSWIRDSVKDYLKICDPFFGREDLGILQLIKSEVSECKVEILTSRKHQNNEFEKHDFENAYRDYWRINISVQEPPETDIVIVGLEESGALPIHDRWWITNGSGLRMGTSLNAIGRSRVSDISILKKEEVLEKEQYIDKYLTRQTRQHQGKKLKYNVFTL